MPRIHESSYTPAEYRALTPDEKAQVIALRKERSDNKKLESNAVITTPIESVVTPAPAPSPPEELVGILKGKAWKERRAQRILCSVSTIPEPEVLPTAIPANKNWKARRTMVKEFSHNDYDGKPVYRDVPKTSCTEKVYYNRSGDPVYMEIPRYPTFQVERAARAAAEAVIEHAHVLAAEAAKAAAEAVLNNKEPITTIERIREWYTRTEGETDTTKPLSVDLVRNEPETVSVAALVKVVAPVAVEVATPPSVPVPPAKPPIIISRTTLPDKPADAVEDVPMEEFDGGRRGPPEDPFAVVTYGEVLPRRPPSTFVSAGPIAALDRVLADAETKIIAEPEPHLPDGEQIFIDKACCHVVAARIFLGEPEYVTQRPEVLSRNQRKKRNKRAREEAAKPSVPAIPVVPKKRKGRDCPERHGLPAYHKRLRNPDGSRIPRLPRPMDLSSSESSDTDDTWGSNPTPFDDDDTYEERTNNVLFGRPIPENFAHRRRRQT